MFLEVLLSLDKLEQQLSLEGLNSHLNCFHILKSQFDESQCFVERLYVLRRSPEAYQDE